MSKIKITRKIMQQVLIVAVSLVGFLTISTNVFGGNSLPLKTNPGVTRCQGSGYPCNSTGTGNISVLVGNSCQTPPITLYIQIHLRINHFAAYTVTVADPGGEIIQSTKLSGDQQLSFIATKIGTYKVTVTDRDTGESATCFGYVRPCKTKTQEEWKASGSPINGGIGQIWVGSRGSGPSLVFNYFDFNCPITFLPATGIISTLPKKFGAVFVNNNECKVPPDLLKDGVFNNPLLGEQIALSLNIMSDGGFLGVESEPLGSLPLCENMVVRYASDSSIHTIRIPKSVVSEFNAHPYQFGYNKDLNGLMNLADYALAGGKLTETNLTDIYSALVEVNKGFGSGSYFVGCQSNDDTTP
jgi:hypothetical protein